MKITPLRNQVLLKKYKPEKKKGALILNTSGEDLYLAKVVSIGSDAKFDIYPNPPAIVRYMPYAAQTIEDGDDEYLLIADENILAIVENL